MILLSFLFLFCCWHIFINARNSVILRSWANKLFYLESGSCVSAWSRSDFGTLGPCVSESPLVRIWTLAQPPHHDGADCKAVFIGNLIEIMKLNGGLSLDSFEFEPTVKKCNSKNPFENTLACKELESIVLAFKPLGLYQISSWWETAQLMLWRILFALNAWFMREKSSIITHYLAARGWGGEFTPRIYNYIFLLPLP